MRRLIFPILLLTMAVQACSNPVSPAPTVTLTVYFTDVARYQVGTEPYEIAVTRVIPAPASLPEAVLAQMFLGPTEAEKSQGLALILSGTTGFSSLTIEDGIVRVYLTGVCASQGASYSIANLIYANLKQFPEIQWIKIYDQNNGTETPNGQSSSIPFCLEPQCKKKPADYPCRIFFTLGTRSGNARLLQVLNDLFYQTRPGIHQPGINLHQRRPDIQPLPGVIWTHDAAHADDRQAAIQFLHHRT